MIAHSGSENTEPGIPVEPAVTVVRITDPTAVKDGLEVVDHDVISLGEDPFLAQRIMLRLENNVLLFHQTSHPLRTYAKIEESRMAVVALGPKAKATYDGVSMRPDTLVLAAPGAEVELVVEAGYCSVTLMISPEDVRDHFVARGRNEEFQVPNGAEFLKCSTSATRSFFNLSKRITQTAKRKPKVFNENASVRFAANLEILEALLAVLRQTTALELTQTDLKRQNFSHIIKTVVTYAELNIEDPLYVSDLCRVAGVSERTLQYAFQEIMKTTPMGYLKLLKLHRVRDELRAASRGSTTVTKLALKWGFWHFGDFSQAYKKCFHELPSETLRA